MIDIWTKPQRRKAVMWLGDNEADIKEFFASACEPNSVYRVVDGRLEYTNDFAFPPNDVSQGADGNMFVYTCPVGNWLVREWEEVCEEHYLIDLSPKEMVEQYLWRKPE